MLLWLRGQVALELGDGGVGVGQLLLDRQGFPVSDQGVLLVADLVGQQAQVEAGLGQASQGLGAGVAVGLEAVAKAAGRRPAAPSGDACAGLRAPGCSSARARWRRRRGTASRRRSPASRAPRRGPLLLGQGLRLLGLRSRPRRLALTASASRTTRPDHRPRWCPRSRPAAPAAPGSPRSPRRGASARTSAAGRPGSAARPRTGSSARCRWMSAAKPLAVS